MKNPAIITFNVGGKSHQLGGGRVFVVAEIGKNYIQTKEDRPTEEYLENAKRLIDAAAEARVDAVKFQTHEVGDEIHPNVSFSSPHFPAGERYEWTLRNTKATPESFWMALKEHAESRGLVFFSTPMSRGAAEKLDKVGVSLWKVGSADVRDYVLLNHHIKTGRPIIISTGMVSFSELDAVVKYLKDRGANYSILYCVSKYPAPKESFNLATIEFLREKYPEAPIGFSDHSVGEPEIALAAVKLGATIIEKHFSFSRDLWGSDHKVSMTPAEMKKFMEAVRADIYKKVDHRPYYGVKGRELDGATNDLRPLWEKALVASRNIKAGEVITEEMVYAVRPRVHVKGLPSNSLNEVVGKSAARDLKKYDPIEQNATV